MKKSILFILALFACSDEDLADFGEVEQGITAQATPTISYGITTGSDKPNCNRTSTGQQCLVPKTKSLSWCVSNGTAAVTDAEAAKISQVATEMQRSINNAMTKFGWTFTHRLDDSKASPEACIGTNPNVIVSLGSTGLCGSASGSNIENYVCSNPTQDTLLTESLPGTYRGMTGGVIIIDYTDVSNKVGGVTADIAKLLYHGLGHNMMGLVGLGAQTTSSNLLTRRAVLPLSNTLGSSVSENCRAVNYNVSSPSSFALHATLGCPD